MRDSTDEDESPGSDRGCQWQPKTAHFWQSKIFHFGHAVVPPDAVLGVSNSVELWVTGLSQRPPRVFASVPAALTRREQLMSWRGSWIRYKGGRAGREAVQTLVRAHPSKSWT